MNDPEVKLIEVIAIDPGQNTTGVAGLEGGTPVEMQEHSYHEFFDWLDEQTPTLFVVENYRIRPQQNNRGFTHAWSSVVPARVIGAVEFHAQRKEIPVVFQEPGILKPAAAMFDLPYPKQGIPMRDAIAAMLHARYWWFKEGAKRKW